MLCSRNASAKISSKACHAEASSAKPLIKRKDGKREGSAMQNETVFPIGTNDNGLHSPESVKVIRSSSKSQVLTFIYEQRLQKSCHCLLWT